MKTMIAIPCMDTVATGFCRSLVALRKPDCEAIFAQSSLVYDSRNVLAQIAVERGFDRILWLDSDMVFNPDLYERLSKSIDEGLDFVCGLYTTRKPPIHVTVYDDVQPGVAHPFDKCPNWLFEIQGSGFGAVMMTTELVRMVGEKFGRPFSPMLGLGEDLSFCYRVSALGRKMYCDGSVHLGHIGIKTYEVSE